MVQKFLKKLKILKELYLEDKRKGFCGGTYTEQQYEDIFEGIDIYSEIPSDISSSSEKSFSDYEDEDEDYDYDDYDDNYRREHAKEDEAEIAEMDRNLIVGGKQLLLKSVEEKEMIIYNTYGTSLGRVALAALDNNALDVPRSVMCLKRAALAALDNRTLDVPRSVM